jgi:hypothetical protein
MAVSRSICPRLQLRKLALGFSALRLRLDQALQLLAIDECAAVSATSVALQQPLPQPPVQRRLPDVELTDGVVGGDQVRHVRSVGRAGLSSPKVLELSQSMPNCAHTAHWRRRETWL